MHLLGKQARDSVPRLLNKEYRDIVSIQLEAFQPSHADKTYTRR